MRFVFAAFLALFCAPAATAAQSADLLAEAVREYRFSDYEAAEEKLVRLLAREPENATAHYYLGLVHLDGGRPERAVEHLERALGASVGRSQVEEALARAYLAAGRGAEAVDHYRRHAAEPENDALTYRYAASLIAAGRPADAEPLLRRLIAAGGAHADAARYRLGVLYADRGAYVSAAGMFEAIDPHSPYRGVARSYLDYLDPLVQPLRLDLSVDYFHHTNPGAFSSDLIRTAGGDAGSDGYALQANLRTRPFEVGDHAQLKLSYLFYGNIYAEESARTYELAAHYLNPILTWSLAERWRLELKGALQQFHFNQQQLSRGWGGTATLSWHPGRQRFSVHAGYLRTRYTDSYESGLLPPRSLRFLDAETPSVGAGARLRAPAWETTLYLDYTYREERTLGTRHPAPLFQLQARDNRFDEHAVRVDLAQPLPGALSRLTLLGNLDYAHRNYPHPQSGFSYASAAGRRIKVNRLTLGAGLRAALVARWDLALTLAFEHGYSHSLADELDYAWNRYAGRLSLRF